MSSEAIRLVERTSGGGWEVVGAAPLDAGFAQGIEALRAEALVRGRACPTVDLWLPAEQLLVRSYQLPADRRGRAEAARRLSADSGYPSDELCVAIAPSEAGESVTVVAALVRTVDEARVYAARWGFEPGRVSSCPESLPFGAEGPVFARKAGPTSRTSRRMAQAAAAAALLGMIGWSALWQAPAEPAPAGIRGTPPILAMAEIDAVSPGLPRSPVAEVRRRRSQPLPARTRVSDLARHRPIPPAIAPAVAPAAVLDERRTGIPAPSLPGQSHPARPAHTGKRAKPAVLAQETDRVRAQLAPPYAAPAVNRKTAALLGGVETAGAAPERAAPRDPAAVGEAAFHLAAATMAPKSVPAAPPPRPETGPARGPASETPPEPEVSVSPLAVDRAPRPPARPEQKAKRMEQAIAHRAVDGPTSPARVRQAAALHGLALDTTSLIGVMDAKSGRQALLRTSEGRFLKVGRGDHVEGWRVTSITRDSVRLSRGSQTRTLLLALR